MPTYQQLFVSVPAATRRMLVKFFKGYTETVIENGGVVRCIENHGIRPLTERAKAKHIPGDGIRYFWEGRYVTCHIDASPACLEVIRRYTENEHYILRYFTTKEKSSIDRIGCHTFKNPYLNVTANAPAKLG